MIYSATPLYLLKGRLSSLRVVFITAKLVRCLCRLKLYFYTLKTQFLPISFFSIFTLMLALPTANVVAEGRSKTYSESSIKAALVYNILHFIEWQTKALTICVYDPDEEEVSSFNALPSQTKSGNTLEVKFLHANGNTLIKNNCHIIFITGEADTHHILTETKNTPRLTIGESAQFIQQGGMINFVRKDLTIKFEVNIHALKQADLQISSQVLRIADRVYTEGDDE